MAGDSLDDDFFSDDGFDALPPSTLLQLELNAFASTQQQQREWEEEQRQQQRGQKRQLSPQTSRQQRVANALHGGPVLQQPTVVNLASSDYGDLDVGELDAGVLDNGDGPAPVEEAKRMLVPGFTGHYT